jgi:hypothetical protein
VWKNDGLRFFVARERCHAKAQRRKGAKGSVGFAALRLCVTFFLQWFLRSDLENEKAMRGKGGMALDFAPFAGITRIRFKGFALSRVSASRLPCVWIDAEHRVHRRRVKERRLTNSPEKMHR